MHIVYKVRSNSNTICALIIYFNSIKLCNVSHFQYDYPHCKYVCGRVPYCFLHMTRVQQIIALQIYTSQMHTFRLIIYIVNPQPLHRGVFHSNRALQYIYYSIETLSKPRIQTLNAHISIAHTWQSKLRFSSAPRFALLITRWGKAFRALILRHGSNRNT